MSNITVGEAESIWRDRVLDKLTTQLFSQDMYWTWLAEAEEEACRRKSLLLDYSTDSVCKIDMVEGQGVYAYSPLILQINYVELDSDSTVLQLTDYGEMNDFRPGWQREDPGKPSRYLLDEQTQHLRVYPTPDAEMALRMTVQRLPMRCATPGSQYQLRDSSVLEIPKAHVLNLLDWVTFRAYTTKDPDADRKDLGMEALGRFESYFGKLPGAEKEARAAKGYPRNQDYGKNQNREAT